MDVVRTMARTGLALMGADEARACVEAIKLHANTMRDLLLDLYEQEGWRALGYASFRACIAAEFKVSQSHAYHLLNAARIDRIIGGDSIPDGHARELAVISEPERVRAVHAEVMEATQGKPTAAAYRQAARPVPKPRSSRHPMVNHAYESVDPFPERTACQCGCIHGCHD